MDSVNQSSDGEVLQALELLGAPEELCWHPTSGLETLRTLELAAWR